MEKAEVACLWCVDAVADPVGLDEHHHVDDGKADGEDSPQHPNSPRVAHVVFMVDLGGFLGRQHVCSFGRFLFFFLFVFLVPSFKLISTPASSY